MGIAYPKVEKVMKYAHLALLLLKSGRASQKQMQIVGGGFVYIAMFRRPLLGALNHIWEFIVSCEHYPPVVKIQSTKGGYPRTGEISRAVAIGVYGLSLSDLTYGNS